MFLKTQCRNNTGIPYQKGVLILKVKRKSNTIVKIHCLSQIPKRTDKLFFFVLDMVFIFK